MCVACDTCFICTLCSTLYRYKSVFGVLHMNVQCLYIAYGVLFIFYPFRLVPLNHVCQDCAIYSALHDTQAYWYLSVFSNVLLVVCCHLLPIILLYNICLILMRGPFWPGCTNGLRSTTRHQSDQQAMEYLCKDLLLLGISWRCGQWQYSTHGSCPG